ncbi:hypothetical protein N7540_008186 [Penicillium herquei]|nr:hypothetical protein N7540_008186 [Penicillium herquei]
MSGPRRLRLTIRMPAALAESADVESPESQAIQSMRQTRARSSAAGAHPLVVPDEPETPVRRRRATRNTSRAVPFNPNLPPAAFPSLPFGTPQTDQSPEANRPGQLRGILRNNGSNRDTRARRARTSVVHFEDEQLEQPEQENYQEVESGDELTRELIEHLAESPVQDIENFARGNTAANPIYVDNMAQMAAMGQDESDDADVSDFEDSDLEDGELEDSDLEEPRDASEELGDKIPDPAWENINPGLQVEIAENMFESGRTWDQTVEALQLNEAEANLLTRFILTRNAQIQRENDSMERMRENQLQALMNIDNSDIRANDVPYQLILRRTIRDTFSELRHYGNEPFPDLLLCQTADVLAGRQYLHLRDLPRSLAGSWGNRLVNLQSSGNSSDRQPERFEWNADLEVESEVTIGGRELQLLQTGNIQRPVRRIEPAEPIEIREVVNPANLVPRPGSPARQAPVDWRRYFDVPTNVSDRSESSSPEIPTETPAYRLGGFIGLRIGYENAARIRDSVQLERVTGRRIPLRDLTPRVGPHGRVYGLAANSPTRASFNAHQLAYLDRLVVTVHPENWVESTQTTFGQPILPDLQAVPPNAPIKRALGGRWSLRLRRFNPAVAQRRYLRQIEAARVEAVEARAQAEAERLEAEQNRLRNEIELEIRNAEAASQRAAARSTGHSPAFSYRTLSTLEADLLAQEMTGLPTMEDVFFLSPNRLNDDPLLSAINGRVSPYNDELDTTGQGFFTPEFIDSLLLMHERRDYATGPFVGPFENPFESSSENPFEVPAAIESVADATNAGGERAQDADGDVAMSEEVLSELTDVDENFFDAMEM